MAKVFRKVTVPFPVEDFCLFGLVQPPAARHQLLPVNESTGSDAVNGTVRVQSDVMSRYVCTHLHSQNQPARKPDHSLQASHDMPNLLKFSERVVQAKWFTILGFLLDVDCPDHWMIRRTLKTNSIVEVHQVTHHVTRAVHQVSQNRQLHKSTIFFFNSSQNRSALSKPNKPLCFSTIFLFLISWPQWAPVPGRTQQNRSFRPVAILIFDQPVFSYSFSPLINHCFSTKPLT